MNASVIRVVSLLAILPILLAVVGCRQGVEIGELQTKSETVESGDAASVQVEIDLAAGELVVNGGAAELLEAGFTYNVAEMEPEVTYSDDKLTITHPEVRIVDSLSDRDDYRNKWDLRFNDGIPMEMNINVGAGRSDLKLGSLALSSLDLKTGAGDVAVDLTGVPSLTQLDFEMGAGALVMDLTGDWTEDLNAGISAGVGDMTLQLPGSVGVRVDVTEGVGKINATNLTRDGDAYVNDAYGESEVTLSFDIKAAVGEINLEGEPAPVAAEPAPAAEEEASDDSQAEQQATQPAITPELLADFESYVEQSRVSLNVPGGAVAIVQGGEIVYAEGFGVKELGSDDPVTADTVFSIGSTTKPLTSAMVASLVDDDLIEWDTPLVEVMPQFQLSDEQATQQITLREALGMTSGLPNTDPVLYFSGQPEKYVEYLAGVPLAAAPGEVYGYHNQMYALGAYAAAMAAGAEYGENLFATYTNLMQERLFDPLGMSSATFSAEEAAASPNHATPHFMGLNATMAETGPDVTPTDYWDLDAIAPSGTLRSSAPDVGRFLITMLSGGVAPDGSRAISAENLAETWTEQIAVEHQPDLEGDGYGMGWHTATYQGIPHITHDGNIGGFSANLAFIPEADAGIVVLSNADVMGGLLSRNAQYRFIEMLFGLEPLTDQAMAAALEGMGGASEFYSQLEAVDPETVAPFLGSYDMEGTPYTVELRDDRLWVSFGEVDHVAELLAAPDGSYTAISGGSDLFFAPFQFMEGDDGGITMVMFGQLELPKHSAPQQAAPEQPDLGAALQGLLDAQVQEQGILGMAMAVRAPDGTVIGKGSGYSDPAGENAWDVDTQSALGSVTKSFTAVVIMQLIEEGRLSLDDTIDAWFPDQPNADKITIRMLLSHTSGLANYISSENVMEGKWTTEWAPMDLVTEANKSGPVDEPGSSDAHYANTNYILLGLIVEEITGNSWAQEVESRIIEPLELRDTTFLSTEGVWGGTMVEGYTKTPDGYVSALELPWYPHHSTTWSAGEVVSTVSDLMTFASALFDGSLVSSETLAVMAQPLGTDVNSGILFGLGGGTMADLPPGGFGMGGDIPGYHAFFLGFLDTNLAVAALVNTEEGDVIMPSIAALQYLAEPQSGEQSPAASASNVYQDPQGRFSLALVGEWTPVETDGTYVQFAYADMPLYMSPVTVAADNLEAGVDAALRQVGVDPAALTQTNRGPWDKWDIFYYTLGDGQGVTVLGQTSDGTSYLIVATGDEALTAQPPEDVLKTIQGFSLSGEEGSLPATVEEFETYVNSFVGTRPPGLSMAIAMGEDVLYEQGFGMADGPREIPATPDSVYHWGSVNKTVTATAIMQLREQGLIDLDAPVSDYLDYFPAQYPITVRHMLTHSSGLPEPADFLMKHLRLKGQPLPDFDAVDREFYEDVPDLMFEPGSQSAYVNPDFVTLGQVVAAVSGQPYVEYVQEHILNPLAMTNTDFTYSNDFMEANDAAPAVNIAEAEALVPLMDEARGLGDGADFFRETGENYAWMNPYIVGESAGGGLMGPATDMIRFGQMMLNEGELDGVRILSAESVSLLQEVQPSTSGEPLGIGLAWHFGEDAEHPYIEHDGGGAGLQAKLRLYMKDGIAVAIMANGSGFDRNELADAAANVVFSMMGQ